LAPEDFYNLLKENNMDFYAGVPDSLLKDFCAYVSDVAPTTHHVITSNEGAAVGLATGYHLATRKFPIVYMQNSGFGNTVNPLLSLADPKVYSIPMLLLIGWRGEPGKKDEPQHIVQGKAMSSLLTDMNIQYEVLPDFIEGARDSVGTAKHYLEKRQGPYAFLVKRQTFTKYSMKSLEPDRYSLTREDALKTIVDHTKTWDILVATTGFTSRELYEYREAKQQDHRREFLTVGAMGHASSIALGVAMSKPSRQVLCLDGDGAAIMHMGAMATIGISKQENLKHILINNGSHDSVGGQPTQGFKIDFPAIAKACGYTSVMLAKTAKELAECMVKLRDTAGPVLLEIRVNKGARKNLGRPKSTPLKNKQEFMKFLEGSHGTARFQCKRLGARRN
jgi:phosphonopyruvate decarboxylase